MQRILKDMGIPMEKKCSNCSVFSLQQTINQIATPIIY